MIDVITPADARPLRMPWRNAIAMGRAYELLREDALAHLRRVQAELGFRYCRFHGIFHDDMEVVVQAGDRLRFQWHLVDKVYDALLAMGLKPFVELGPMPKALASGSQTIFHWKMNVTPPSDYGRWAALVTAFASHVIDRYGIAEVRSWYFEVWNEPDLGGFWSGTQAEYWLLYAASARALKAVHPELRVGGPATSKASRIQDFIDHCCTQSLPLDFVSTHLYPQDEYVIHPDRKGSPHAIGDFFQETVKSIRTAVQASRRPDLEIHWTEWNAISSANSHEVEWVRNATNDSIFAAALIVRACIALDQAADTLCYWVASDIFEECGLPHAPFSGTYGLLTIHGIPKASFPAFSLLRRMRGDRLQAIASALPVGCGAAASRSGGSTHVLLWHQRLLELADQPTWKETLRFANPGAGAQVVISSRIHPGAGSYPRPGKPWDGPIIFRLPRSTCCGPTANRSGGSNRRPPRAICSGYRSASMQATSSIWKSGQPAIPHCRKARRRSTRPD